MKKHITIIALLGSLLVLLVATASAQSMGNQVRSYVPFTFVAGGATLPASAYVIERINRQTSMETLLLRSSDGRHRVLLSGSSQIDGRPQDEAQLVFRCYGETCLLAQIRGVGDGAGLQLQKSRRARRLEREALKSVLAPRGNVTAQGGVVFRTVAVLLRQK